MLFSIYIIGYKDVLGENIDIIMSNTTSTVTDESSTNDNDDEHNITWEKLIACTNELKHMQLSSEVDTCANCGKEGNNLNICNKCGLVAYCNATCKKKHRSKHKKKCERRVAELRDMELFQEPPPKDDCPMCLLPLPSIEDGNIYKSCCGKIICSGCAFTDALQGEEDKCPVCLCKTPGGSTSEEAHEMMMKRMDFGDATAMYNLGCAYRNEDSGLPQSSEKSIELWLRAAKLGNADAQNNMGAAHFNGYGVEYNVQKAMQYLELAAKGGNLLARHSLGSIDQDRDLERSMKHYMIAVRGGCTRSLDKMGGLYKNERITKEDYTEALRAYQTYLSSIKSEHRDIAAAYDDCNRYY